MTLNSIIEVIKASCIEIKNAINNTNCSSLAQQTGSNNSSGDNTKYLDQLSHNILLNALSKNENVYGIISEEHNHIHKTPNTDASYIVAFDPLDGSSNIEFNVTIGTIFAIYAVDENKQIKSGNNIVASGYCLYGFKTEFVYTNPNTDCVEMLQLIDNQFVLVKNKISLENIEKGKYYSINYGNADKWDPPQIYNVITHLNNSGYSQRYVGSMVADTHRVLLNGGLFMYPADSKNKTGKIRLLYEAYPFAFLIEKAGGQAIADYNTTSILNIKMPNNIHQTTPVILGTNSEVDIVFEILY